MSVLVLFVESLCRDFEVTYVNTSSPFSENASKIYREKYDDINMLGRRNQFLVFFPNCTGSKLYITPQLLKGLASGSSVHSALWKYFLVVEKESKNKFVKADDWITILKAKRDKFYELKSQYFIKPPDDEEVDPLLASQNTAWSQYFNDQELRQQIARDTSRAFQELDFFQDPDTQHILEDILFLFCRTHPAYGYPQGLHELAAFIFYIFSKEMIAEENDTISFIFNQAAVVPDAYWTFSALAEAIEPLYRPSQDTTQLSYCGELANEIQSARLSKHDRKLSKILQDEGIQPHTYMLNWLRLLFLRVFELEPAAQVWDIILLCQPNIDVIANTCLALLLDASSTLVNEDSTGILHYLFKYPKKSNAYQFAVKGYQITFPKKSGSESNVNSIVAERLSELTRHLNELCTTNGYEKAIPYIMDLSRTRDILLGIIPIDEMLPLEQAIELFKPVNVEQDLPQYIEEEKEKPAEKHIELPRASKIEASAPMQNLFNEEENISPLLIKAKASAETDLFGDVKQVQPKGESLLKKDTHEIGSLPIKRNSLGNDATQSRSAQNATKKRSDSDLLFDQPKKVQKNDPISATLFGSSAPKDILPENLFGDDMKPQIKIKAKPKKEDDSLDFLKVKASKSNVVRKEQAPEPVQPPPKQKTIYDDDDPIMVKKNPSVSSDKKSAAIGSSIFDNMEGSKQHKSESEKPKGENVFDDDEPLFVGKKPKPESKLFDNESAPGAAHPPPSKKATETSKSGDLFQETGSKIKALPKKNSDSLFD